MTPTVTGHTTATVSGASSTFTVDPSVNVVGSSVATDDWIILVLTSSGNATNTRNPTAPGGWTSLVTWGSVGAGNFTFGVWAHKRAGGETSYTWTQTTAPSQSTYQRMVFVSGADDVANWITGAFDFRVSTGTSTTNVAASITTTAPNTLGLLLSGERTTAAETDPQVTCTNFTKQWFENNQDHTLFVATKDMTSAGSTGSSTVTYPNAQTDNGIAGIIGIPAPVVSGTIPLMWVNG